MTDYAVFLRGVNVGGITLKMAELRTAIGTLPVTRVATQLASGNLTCSSDLTTQDLKDAVEALLRSAFGYDAWVVILDAGRLRELVDACPFPADDPTTHTYITLFSNPAALTDLVEAIDKTVTSRAAASNEAVASDSESTGALGDFRVLGPDAAAWLAPRGGTLDSPLSKILGKPHFKNSSTTRNLRTLHKVLGVLEQ
ncbi:DUF1697 domain-containing protein [Arthrobacter sp. CAN_C5]|uniref:DUF1697 domain-containing protein n=1 Tax=Arthrobacter sp. CAN_C5 TaxID=2760706 RepID=UPI001AE755F0|nr:DUF1697 domain-containing protein [Arthrobacter sp. CAN_C5]MBP2216254.1 uncharacterized protein (DUF1697 family) [Arthrobacter sp. CAN_C5]